MKARVRDAVYSAAGHASRRWGSARTRRRLLELPADEDFPYDIEARVLRKLGVAGAVLDIGGNSGLYSVALEDLVGPQSIHIFEPLPHLAQYLRAKFPKAHIHQVALSDREGEATLTIPFIAGRRFDTRATLESHRESGQSSEETVRTVVRRLDDVVAEESLDNIGLVKIDVEGHEMRVLMGARETLSTQYPLLVVEIEARHHDYPIAEVFAWLETLGYKGFFIDPAPNLVLWSAREHDPATHQDMELHARREFHRYLNNFFFVHRDNAEEFTEAVAAVLASERAALGGGQRMPSPRPGTD